jgi:hypothetical protein
LGAEEKDRNLPLLLLLPKEDYHRIWTQVPSFPMTKAKADPQRPPPIQTLLLPLLLLPRGAIILEQVQGGIALLLRTFLITIRLPGKPENPENLRNFVPAKILPKIP